MQNRFLHEAFDPEQRARLLRKIKFRRNFFMFLFLLCLTSALTIAYLDGTLIALTILFAGVVALVFTSKYNTLLCFLRILIRQEELRRHPPPPPWEEV